MFFQNSNFEIYNENRVRVIYQQLAKNCSPEPEFCVQKRQTAARSFLLAKMAETVVLSIAAKPFKKGPIFELYQCPPSI
jgi:hypothetical protein